MARDDLRDRITGQFSYRDDRADIWRAFDLFLDTDRFLNLGYSPRFVPHLLGSCQRRLVSRVGSTLASTLPGTEGVRLLDVGSGRGGPTAHLARRHGFRAIGVDLVPHNVARAREHAGDADASFVVGDAADLPIRTGTMGAATAIDSIVYLDEKAAVFSELSRVLDANGVLVASDLVRRAGTSDTERETITAFADAWDMPPPISRRAYVRGLEEAGFRVRSVEDITANSVGRFRRWTTLYLGATDGPLGGPIDRLLRRRDLNPSIVDEQIRRAHDALPWLGHVLVVAVVR